jgi:methylated-DNA-[protein]-cysteine S-methyltransferase
MDARGAVRTTIAGPFGPLHVAATARGVVAVEWLTTDEAFETALRRRGVVEIVPSTAVERNDPRRRNLDTAVAALKALAAGRTPKTRVALDLTDRPAWDRRVLETVATIPWGATASYGEVARRVGAPRAARAVGGAVGRNPISLLVPCHRVIAADGTIGGYGSDGWGSREDRLARKRALLLREGVTVDAADR